jgi:hypothetical protein
VFSDVVDRQVSGNRKEPGFETGAAVIVRTALDYTQPGFLDQIVNVVTAAQEIDEVAHQAVLVKLDQFVEERYIPLP